MGYWSHNKCRSGMTTLELVIASAIMLIVVGTLLPLFAGVRNSWDAKAGNSEMLQNARVLTEHIHRHLSEARKIADVSPPSESRGYIVFEDNDGNNLRYDVAADNLVQFGPVGSLSDLAGPVSQMQLTCYSGHDFENATTDVNSIRYVEVELTVINAASFGRDLQFATSAFLRTNGQSIGSHKAITGATYYVRSSGDDAADGLTPETAWCTVQKAALTMGAGDGVYVGAGTYSGPVAPANDGTASEPIHFIADTDGAGTGDAGPVRIVNAAGYGLQISSDDYIRFTGFKISAASGISWTDSAGGVLDDCEIYGSDTEGIWAENAQLALRRCHVHDNATTGVMVVGGAMTLTNCLIPSNQDNGVYLEQGAPTVQMWHCTMAENGGSGIKQDSGDLTLTNSIVVYNDGNGLEIGGGASIVHTYNNINANVSGNYSGTNKGTGEIVRDPQFVSATDYHLQSTAPAVDSGTVGSSATSIDCDGAGRPVGEGWDMGCYEYGAIAPSTVLP